MTDNAKRNGRLPANLPHRQGGRATLDPFDRELVAYVVSWAPFGGPPIDEILPQFGIGSESLKPRIRQIIANNRGRNLVIQDRVLLLRALALLNSQRLPGGSTDEINQPSS